MAQRFPLSVRNAPSTSEIPMGVNEPGPPADPPSVWEQHGEMVGALGST